MRGSRRLIGRLSACILMAASGALLAQQPGPAAATAASAAAPARGSLPDWSGTWELERAGFPGPAAAPPSGPGGTRAAPARRTPYDGLVLAWTPKGKRKFEQIRAIAAAGGDVPSRSYQCIPVGVPMVVAGVEAEFEFLFSPGRVTMLLSPNNETRRIYTDGRPQDSDPDTSFDGSSVGHWEGQTLVVDTVGLDPKNEFIYAIPGGKHMHVSERMFLKGPDSLQIDTVIEAPEMISEPYRYTKTYRRTRRPMLEAYCAQNNRDLNDQTGRQQVDLTPPSDLTSSSE